MKKLNLSIIVLLMLSTFCSCIDSKYHWDNLNKEGVWEVPPVPLGAFKAIVIKDLFEEPLEIKDLPTGTYAGYYDFENLFGDKSIKNFFHDYVERDIVLAGKLQLEMFGWDSELKIELGFNALDENKKVLDKVKIKGNINDIDGNLIIKPGTQNIKIIISQEDAPKMRAAEHLQMEIKLTTPKNITITNGDSIKLSNMIIKTAGYLVDL